MWCDNRDYSTGTKWCWSSFPCLQKNVRSLAASSRRRKVCHSCVSTIQCCWTPFAVTYYSEWLNLYGTCYYLPCAISPMSLRKQLSTLYVRVSSSFPSLLLHQDIDTALLKLLAETRSSSLTDIVSTSEPYFVVTECIAVLEMHQVKYETGRHGDTICDAHSTLSKLRQTTLINDTRRHACRGRLHRDHSMDLLTYVHSYVHTEDVFVVLF